MNTSLKVALIAGGATVTAALVAALVPLINTNPAPQPTMVPTPSPATTLTPGPTPGPTADSEIVGLNERGATALGQGQYREALNYYTQALAIAGELGDTAEEGSALNSIGVVYENQGLYDQALNSYEQALVIRREVVDRLGEGVTLGNIGGVYAQQGLLDQALNNYGQALVIYREVRDRAGEGITVGNIGAVYSRQGLYDQALNNYQQALVIQREVGDRAGEGAILSNTPTCSSKGQHRTVPVLVTFDPTGGASFFLGASSNPLAAPSDCREGAAPAMRGFVSWRTNRSWSSWSNGPKQRIKRSLCLRKPNSGFRSSSCGSNRQPTKR